MVEKKKGNKKVNKIKQEKKEGVEKNVKLGGIEERKRNDKLYI